MKVFGTVCASLQSLRQIFCRLNPLPGRFYSQRVSAGLKGSDAVFNPSTRILTRADREFEFLGPKTNLQGSVRKIEDAPKLKLPEVMFCLSGEKLNYKMLQNGIYG